MRCAVPPLFCRAAMKSRSAGSAGEAPSAIALSMRGRSCMHHAAGAEIGVADLGIAHLAGRAGRRNARSPAAGHGASAPSAGASSASAPPRWRCRRVRALAPAVENAEDQGLGRAAAGIAKTSAVKVRWFVALYKRDRRCRSLPVIGMAGEDLLRPVELLEQHAAHQKMRPGHRVRATAGPPPGRGPRRSKPSAPPISESEFGERRRRASRAKRSANPWLDQHLAARVEGDEARIGRGVPQGSVAPSRAFSSPRAAGAAAPRARRSRPAARAARHKCRASASNGPGGACRWRAGDSGSTRTGPSTACGARAGWRPPAALRPHIFSRL